MREAFVPLIALAAQGIAIAGVNDPIDLLAPRLPAKGQTPSSVPTQTPTSTAQASGEIAPFDRLARDNVRVEAFTLTSGSKEFVSWSTRWGSYSKDVTQKKLVQIHLSGIGNSGGPALVEVFQVVKNNGGKDLLVKVSKSEMIEDGAGTWCVALRSDRNDTHYASTGVTEKSGEKMMGYFVRVIRDNRIVGFSASPSLYDRYAENPKSMP